MGRAGYIDDELIVYNSITAFQRSSQPEASEDNFGIFSFFYKEKGSYRKLSAASRINAALE